MCRVKQLAAFAPVGGRVGAWGGERERVPAPGPGQATEKKLATFLKAMRISGPGTLVYFLKWHSRPTWDFPGVARHRPPLSCWNAGVPCARRALSADRGIPSRQEGHRPENNTLSPQKFVTEIKPEEGAAAVGSA